MSGLIEPKVLKGFRDFLPEQERERAAIERALTRAFESHGFAPIDTPAIEYAEVLLGKGGGETDKQVYRFLDHGGRDVALRFDLTVPFARFMAAHAEELYLPFKRYHIAKVWRGENTQRGRYREFTQCDFDVVGVDSPSADFEILLAMHASFAALGFERITIRLSHRGVLNRFLDRIGAGGASADVLRAIDKIGKIGAEEVAGILRPIVGEREAAEILDFIEPDGDFESTLAKMTRLAGGEAEDTARLSELRRLIAALGLEDRFALDPSITRGLDYYTGIVCETFLTELPEIGSVCSGGRYNSLASLYTKRELPGVGASVGLDRLVAAFAELNVKVDAASGTEVLVFNLDDSLGAYYHRVARSLREAGLSCEVYPERKKLAAQFAFAEKKGTPVAVICGEEEAASDTVTVKDLRGRRSSERLTLQAGIEHIKRVLDRLSP